MKIFLAILALFLAANSSLALEAADQRLDDDFQSCIPHYHLDKANRRTVFDAGWEKCDGINEQWTLKNNEYQKKCRANRTACLPGNK